MPTLPDIMTPPREPVPPEALEGDLIQPGNPLFGLIWINPERVSGAPRFAGTRVPIKNLFDYLESGYSVGAFLNDFDGIARDQAVKVIESARAGLLGALPKP